MTPKLINNFSKQQTG